MLNLYTNAFSLLPVMLFFLKAPCKANRLTLCLMISLRIFFFYLDSPLVPLTTVTSVIMKTAIDYQFLAAEHTWFDRHEQPPPHPQESYF